MNFTRETLRLYWKTAWDYPRYVVGVCLSIPITILLGNFLPPLILARVLNRLSHGDYQAHNLWQALGVVW